MNYEQLFSFGAYLVGIFLTLVLLSHFRRHVVLVKHLQHQLDEFSKFQVSVLKPERKAGNNQDNTRETMTAEVAIASERLNHSEKLMTLGQLTAGIAHELNNPLNFISGGIVNLRHQLSLVNGKVSGIDPVILSDLDTSLNVVTNGCDRAIQIINSLKKITYEGPQVMEDADVIENLESTLLLIQSETRNRITIHRNYGVIPRIECNIGAINQVFLNILINSVQAIEEAGNLTLSVSADETRNTLTIKIKDDGVGISESHLPHVFDVYFTTKPIGKGTGLGLPISRDIVLRHKGNLEIKSIAAIGTEVSITLPIRQNDERV